MEQETETSWWEPFVPADSESYREYIARARYFPLEFVMMEHTNENLDIIAEAQELLATPHSFKGGLWCCMVIRDLVFLVYTEEYQNGAI